MSAEEKHKVRSWLKRRKAHGVSNNLFMEMKLDKGLCFHNSGLSQTLDFQECYIPEDQRTPLLKAKMTKLGIPPKKKIYTTFDNITKYYKHYQT